MKGGEIWTGVTWRKLFGSYLKALHELSNTLVRDREKLESYHKRRMIDNVDIFL